MIGFVVGLEAEAQIARGFGCPVAVGGGGAAGAATAVASLIAEGVTHLVSFGLAGGLAPGLPAGEIVVPERVRDGAGKTWLADPALSMRFGPMHGVLLAAADIVATSAAKAKLWQETGTMAADLESGAVAGAGLPFAILRAICDPAERDLPPAALTALDASGRIKPLALAGSLARHPGQIGALIGLGRDAVKARAALLALVRRIGPLSP